MNFFKCILRILGIDDDVLEDPEEPLCVHGAEVERCIERCHECGHACSAHMPACRRFLDTGYNSRNTFCHCPEFK